jgi:ribose/xylose/arabinose/galactoside ABC-type transport system permease subunit
MTVQSQVETVPVLPTAARPRRRFGIRFTEAGLVAVVLMIGTMLAIFGGSLRVRDSATGHLVTVNKFLRLDNLDLVMKDTSYFAIMATGATFVILTGGIDLSIGATYCLSAVSGAMFLSWYGPSGVNASPVWTVPTAILLCLGVGTVCGLLNGVGVVLLRIHPFVITLGTMAIFRGIAFVMSKAQSFTNFPPQFTDGLIRYQIAGHLYPVPMAIMFGVVIVAGIFLKHFVAGRKIFAVGGNEQAALYSGLAVNRVKLLVYAVSGLSAGVASVIMLGYYGSASSDAGKGYELDVIAAAVVGGASLAGGRGTVLGALLGALIIQLIDNGIIILNIDNNYSQIIIGAVIIVAVVLERTSSVFRQRRLARSAHSSR